MREPGRSDSAVVGDDPQHSQEGLCCHRLCGSSCVPSGPSGVDWPTVFMGQGNTVFIMQGKKRSRNFSWAKLDIVVSRTLVGIGCDGLRCQWQQQGVCRGVLGLSCSAPAQP